MQKKVGDKENIHEGHRQRLLNLVISSGIDNVSEIQALEFTLSYIYPRGDTNPLAHRLLNKFGTYADVLDADVNDLQTVLGVGERAAKLITQLPELFHYYTCSRLKEKALLNSKAAMFDFCELILRLSRVEELYIVALDANMRLKGYRRLAKGAINMVGIKQNEIKKFLNTYTPSYVFLMHNHPGGYCLPSKQDKTANQNLSQMFMFLGVNFIDHFIIGSDGIASIGEDRKMREFIPL